MLHTVAQSRAALSDDATACEDVGRYDVTLQTKTVELEILGQARPEIDVQAVLPYLRQARDYLHQAAKSDSRQELQKSLTLLGPLLSQFLPQIAARLDAAVDALQFPALVSALSSIASEWSAGQPMRPPLGK